MKNLARGHALSCALTKTNCCTIKWKLLMKVSSITAVLVLLSANVLMAGRGSAQSLTTTRVKVGLKQEPLIRAFKQIEKQTSFRFTYNDQVIGSYSNISIPLDTRSMAETLTDLFAGTSLTYKVINNTIGVFEKEETILNGAADTLITVKGQVLNEDNQPVSKAVVVVRGSIPSRQTYTDTTGNFELRNVPPHGTLLVSKPEYIIDFFPVKGTTALLHIQHTWASRGTLTEVVVVGYGVKKKEQITGSVSSINAEQITEMPATNLSQVFAGRIPGVLARTSAGSPGDEVATLSVRTTSTGQPLLVVDGVPRFNASSPDQVNLNSIDPNEVESITVLKDNASTAIYGARAANGVILITTKRGKTGRAQFSYSGNYTWNTPTKMAERLDAYGYALATNETYVNSGLSPLYSAGILDTIKQQLAPYLFANTNWLDSLTRNKGFTQNHSMSVSGGNEAMRYFILGTYTNEGGIFATNYYKRYTLQSNFDINLSRQFKAQVNLGYRNSYQRLPGGGLPSSILNLAVGASPLAPAYMPNGAYGGTTTGTNPFASVSDQSGYQYTALNYLTASGRLTWESSAIRGLSAYTNLYIEKRFTRGKNYQVPVPTFNIDATSPSGYKQVGGTGNPSVTDNNSDATTSTIDFAVSYNKFFGRHAIDLLALYTVSQTQNNTNTDQRLNLAAPGLDILNLGSTVGETTTGTRSLAARAGYAGRISYNFDRRLYLEASFREDASTFFAPGHRWGFFPGASAGWILSKENWMRSTENLISHLKLRASVGLTGDDGSIGASTYYYTYRIANTGTQNTQGYIFGTTYTPSFFLANSTQPNENITWAKNLQYNTGFDAILWKGRLGITFDIYQKNRYDILLSPAYNLPATFGIGGPLSNFGKTRDRGFEIALTSENKLSKDWSLSLNANMTFVQSIYIDNGTSTLPDYQHAEGHSVNSYVSYKAVGIFQSADEIKAWPVNQDGLGNSSIKPGDIKYADLDGDGKLTAADQVWNDHYNVPPINYGFGFNLRYKSLTLTTFFNGALGGYVKYSNIFSNIWKYYYDNAWRPDNAGAIFPRLSNSSNNTRTSDLGTFSNDFLRLRDLRISYILPAKWLKLAKISGGISRIMLYAQATNLLTFTSLKGGVDPETPNIANVSPNFYPNQRYVGVGVNVSF